jgi:hypothetical protein
MNFAMFPGKDTPASEVAGHGKKQEFLASLK